MANAWFTDGGRYQIVCEPTANANIYYLTTAANAGNHEIWVADWSNPETPAPMSKIIDYTENVEFLACVFKTKPIPPFDPQYEYEVRCYAKCVYKVGASESPYAFTFRCRVAIVNTTLDTVVLETTSLNWGAALNIYIQDTAFIDGPYLYAYFGNEDPTVGDDLCGIGTCGFRRYLADGTYLDVGSSTAQGGGCWVSRKWMRENLGVDIYPDEAEPDPEVDDPNEDDDGYSGPGGGGGDHNHDTDDIDIPSLPSLTAIDTGFVTMYVAGLPAIQALAAELWDNSIVAIVEKFFEHPWDYVEGLAICPCTPDWESIVYPKIGSHTLNTTLRLVSNQYTEIDCGSIDLNEFYGSALDYSPYERLQIHLPYCGSHDLDIDEVMGTTLKVTYHVDCFSGACIAFVSITGRGATDGVRYQFTGNVLSHIPITSRSYDEVVKATAQLAAPVAGSLLAPGPSAGATLGAGGKKATAKQIARAEHAQAVQDYEDNMSLATTAANVMGAKPQIMRSGSNSSTMGFMGVQKPFITRTIPRQSLPENYRTYEGYPSNITEVLGSLKGFTKVYSIRPNGFSCTAEELVELVSLLKEGVIL